MAPKTQQRTYISDRFILELDDEGAYVGTLQAVEGGSMKAAGIVDEKVGGESLVTKYSGRPQYEDVTVQVGMAMAPRFWKWLSASFNNYDAQRVNGSIVALDYDNQRRWRRSFENALISEIGFPALDGAAKEPAYLTVKFAVEKMEQKKDSGPYDAEREKPGEWEKQRLWLPSNFSFKVDKFGSGKKVPNAKMDGFTIKQEIIVCPNGKELIPSKEPGRHEFPNLSVTVMERDAKPWLDWYQKAVRDGHNDPANETTGHVEYLKRDTETPLMIVDIYGMGILAINPVKHDSKQAQIQKIKVDLYCENMILKPGAGTT